MGCLPSLPSKKAQGLESANIRRNELNLRATALNYATCTASRHSETSPYERKNKLEEIIDPDEIPVGSHVRSPSGNLLNAQEFRDRSDRPPCMRERQQRILERTRTYGNLAEAAQAQNTKRRRKRQNTEVICASDGLAKGLGANLLM